MNYELIENDICKMEHYPEVMDRVTQLLLTILLAYDEQEKKEDRLLDLAEKIDTWLSKYDNLSKEQSSILCLNHFQIIKRRKDLDVYERIKLGELVNDCVAEIRIGALLLLDAVSEAQKIFDELNIEKQKVFLTYPICHFGNLVLK